MSKPRSVDQHRRFFAVIKAAFDNWPEAHSFQPDSAEHLRAWLLVKAKHRVINEFYLDGDADEMARVIPVITASMLRKHSWAWAKGNCLYVCVPVSINFETVSHQEFQKINDDVDEIIRVEAGLDPDALLREKAA